MLLKNSYKKMLLDLLRAEPDSTFLAANMNRKAIESNPDIFNRIWGEFQKNIDDFDADENEAYTRTMKDVLNIEVADFEPKTPAFLQPSNMRFNADDDIKRRIGKITNHIASVAEVIGEKVYRYDTYNGDLAQMFNLLKSDMTSLEDIFNGGNNKIAPSSNNNPVYSPGKKTYRKTLTVTSAQMDAITRALEWCEGKDPDDRMDEDDKFSVTAKFPDGFEMDVEVCGVQYEEGADTDNSAWTQAVLFNPKGGQVAFTEPDDEFLGDWELETDDAIYSVTIEVA